MDTERDQEEIPAIARDRVDAPAILDLEQDDPVLAATRYFGELREKALDKLNSDPAFRSRRISELVRFLKLAAADSRSPWDVFSVPQDLKLCIQYTDERRGNALIRTILDLLVEDLLGNVDVAILFRDKDNPVFTDHSPATNKVFRVFRSAGVHLIELQTEWRADFHALIGLRRIAEMGTLTYSVKGGQARPVSPEHVREFMERGFESGLLVSLADIVRAAVSEAEADAREGGLGKN
jgi:hypothetical protein